MKLDGKLVREDLGAGAWVLETDGARFLLDGDVPAGLEGKAVTVEGSEAPAFGFSMSAEKVIRISKITRS